MRGTYSGLAWGALEVIDNGLLIPHIPQLQSYLIPGNRFINPIPGTIPASTMSSTNIRYACEGDTPGLSKINIDAFSNTGKFITNTFPGASRDSLIVYKGAVAVKHLADPKKHVLAAVELSTGEIVGYTRWEIPRGIGYDHDMPPLSEKGTYALENQMEFAPKPMNEELYNAFKRFLEQKRKQFATDDDLG